jgi:hypothetical protein
MSKSYSTLFVAHQVRGACLVWKGAESRSGFRYCFLEYRGRSYVSVAPETGGGKGYLADRNLVLELEDTQRFELEYIGLSGIFRYRTLPDS